MRLVDKDNSYLTKEFKDGSIYGYNKAIDDVVKMIKDGIITSKKDLISDLENMKNK